MGGWFKTTLPADGHPGQAYGCRCTAEPVLPDILPLDPDPPEISDEDWAAELLGKVSSWLVTIF